MKVLQFVVPVPQTIEQNSDAIQLVPRQGSQHRLMEQIVALPLPEINEETADVSHLVPYQRIQERLVEQIVAFPMTQIMRTS